MNEMECCFGSNQPISTMTNMRKSFPDADNAIQFLLAEQNYIQLKCATQQQLNKDSKAGSKNYFFLKNILMGTPLKLNLERS